MPANAHHSAFACEPTGHAAFRWGWLRGTRRGRDLAGGKKVDLTENWQSFEDEIVAPADEGNARIHFDLGDSGVSVDLAEVSLTPR